MPDADQYYQATQITADDLRTIARSLAIDEVTRLALPEVDEVVDVVSRVVPAGNVPALILSGLSRLNGRNAHPDIVKRDVNMLFKGVETMLDKAVYGTFFAGPAAVIWGYQNLLKLAGKDPNDSFPEGTWQFYVEYALREDTARHANETHGFDTTLNRHGIKLSRVDRITAWVMSAIRMLADYDNLLENEWRERVYTDLLKKAASGFSTQYDDVYINWQKQIPYSKRSDSKEEETYSTYRRRKFDEYFEPIIRKTPSNVMGHWLELVRDAKIRDLRNYIKQMTILATLQPSNYNETRIPIERSKALIGVIHRGVYYFIPMCRPGTQELMDVHTVRRWVAAILKVAGNFPPAELSLLANLKRSVLPTLNLSDTLRHDLQLLQSAPILINTDIRPRYLPLAEIRQTERGIGDHPLTLFDTGETFVFDQSHIFFDGTWGAAFAEIMTNEAIAWGVYLSTLNEVVPAPTPPTSPAFQLTNADRNAVRHAACITAEVSAENDTIKLERLVNLRQMFKQRSQQIKLTVNDLLLLYRAIHGLTYTPNPDLLHELEKLAQKAETSTAAKAALHAIQEHLNPTILMPVDASQTNPRDRLYPISFEVPLADLNLIGLHDKTLAALDDYINTRDTMAYDAFYKHQRKYLATLAGFGEVMVRAKAVAVSGESASVGTIKLLAHMPMALRRLLDKIPNRFDVLNDIIKGREVFSNIGQVAPNSSLCRFITAKDDNDKKTLAWGVITDTNGVIHLS
ncbi:MAG: hypothetical protein CUN56_08285, partial [Phototrophicales bacterium]